MYTIKIDTQLNENYNWNYKIYLIAHHIKNYNYISCTKDELFVFGVEKI